MTSFVLRVRVAAADAELAADELWSLGVPAVGEEGSGAPGTVVLVTSFVDRGAAAAARDRMSARGTAWLEAVTDDYLDAWRAHADAVRVGDRLVVVPPWVAEPALEPGDVVVSIDPERAFGSGAHATTRLVLAAVERLMTPGATVLDVGCGSGVLAVAALRLGASRAVGVDVDPAAQAATRTNARANGVDVAVVGALDDVEGAFDLVLANVLAPVLVALAPALRERLAPEGRLVVSGVLPGRWAHVAEALAPLRVLSVDELAGWSVLTLGW